MKKHHHLYFKHAITILLIMLALTAPFSIRSHAAVKKVKQLTRKQVDNAAKPKKLVNKNAFIVKKGKKYNLKAHKGFLKFVAPSNGKYTFEYSNLKAAKKSNNKKASAVIDLVVIDGNGFILDPGTPVKTQGSSWKSNAHIASKAYIKKAGSANKKLAYSERYLSSRYSTLKCYKGDILYLYVDCKVPSTFTIKVKKK